jgi:hypothetical protein
MTAFDVVDGARSRHRSAIGWFVEDELILSAKRPNISYRASLAASFIFDDYTNGPGRRKSCKRGIDHKPLPSP